MVRDDHIALLRAVLVGDVAGYERIAGEARQAKAEDGFNYLVAGAFCELISRRFGSGYSLPDIIRFVGEMRAGLEDVEDDFDARIAERLILAALGNGSLDGIDERAKGQAQIGLLTAMVDRENFDDAGLDDLLSAARKVADGTPS